MNPPCAKPYNSCDSNQPTLCSISALPSDTFKPQNSINPINPHTNLRTTQRRTKLRSKANQGAMASQKMLWAVLLVLVSTCAADEDSEMPQPPEDSEYMHTMKALGNITSNLELVATEGEVVADDCERQIQSASETLTWISTQLPSTTLGLLESADFFRSAAKAVSACNAYLSVRADSLPASVYHKSRNALSTAHQMLTQLSTDCELAVADIDNELNKTSNLANGISHSNNATIVTPKDDDEDVQRCTYVNPTNCQFSACGKGKRLPLCAFGYATGVSGGLKGKSYVVTNNEDDHNKPSPGSLRFGVNQGGQAHGGVWITFARSFVITLSDLLWIKSGTTIDGRGFNVTITGRSIVLCGVSNVILHNFQISTVGESDTVHIFAGSSKVWVDHLTSTDAKLGLVSVLQGSTDVTISNSHLSNYNFNQLLGASDFDKEDADMRVSVYRNWFKDSMQRMPHCRWGKCHVLNNLYSNWGYYALGARANGKIYSEYNAFLASRRSEITPWFNGIGSNYDHSIYISSSKDVFLNGSTLHEFLTPEETQSVEEQGAIYKNAKMYPPLIPPGNLNKVVPLCVGAVFGHRLQQCSA